MRLIYARVIVSAALLAAMLLGASATHVARGADRAADRGAAVGADR